MTTVWERGGYVGEEDSKGVLSITAPNGMVLPDDGTPLFGVAWAYAGGDLPPDTCYGVAWNRNPNGLADLGLPFVDDPFDARSRKGSVRYAEVSGAAAKDDFAARLAWIALEGQVAAELDAAVLSARTEI